MQLKPKSNSIITHERLESGAIRFHVQGAGFVDFDMAKASAANRAHAALHGFVQRISDGAAMSRDEKTGLAATPAEKLAAMERLVEHYESGAEEWRLAGGGEGRGSLTIEAIARIRGVEYDTAEAQVEAYAAKRHAGDTRAALAFLRKGKRVMEAMDALRRERMPEAKVDADQALEEMR